MSHTFTRGELFELVWSAPTRTIAKQLGISDVGLAKACRRADLLLPPRGYWAKLAAGKRVNKPELPPRAPGMRDRVVLGQSRWNWSPAPIDLTTPDPPAPVFGETLDELAARLRRQIGPVRRTRDLERAHPRILRLLEADEQRGARRRESPFLTFDAPIFESPFEQRRLRILNSVLRALDQVSVSVSINDREARDLIAHVADYGVSFTLDAVLRAPPHQDSQEMRGVGRRWSHSRLRTDGHYHRHRRTGTPGAALGRLCTGPLRSIRTSS